MPTFAKTAPARSLGSTLEGARNKAPSAEERHKMRVRKIFRQVEALATLRTTGIKRLKKKPAPGKLPNVCPADTIISENVMITANIYRDVVSKHAEEFNTLRKELQYR